MQAIQPIFMNRLSAMHPITVPHRLRQRCTIAALLAAPLISHAQAPKTENWLVVSGASYHFRQENHDWREVNPGLGFERTLHYRDFEQLYLVGGYFKNSYDKHALHAGVRWMPWGWQWGKAALRFGGYALVSTGYPSPVLVLPGMSLEYDRVGMNVVVAPNIRDHSGYVGVQVKFRLE